MEPNRKTKRETRERFPITLRSGSVSAKIYRLTRDFVTQKGKVRREVYTLAYSTPDGRKVRQFGKLSSAKEEGRIVVDQLAAGEADGALMSKADRAELLAAREAATDAPSLLSALEEWREARRIAGAEILVACRAWQKRQTRVVPVLVPDVIKRFSDAKRAEGVVIENSYEAVLNAFKAAFPMRTLDSLHTREITAWLSLRKNHTTRNTYRKRLVTLFRWARDQEFLPRDLLTEAERTKAAKEAAPSRSLITPETLRAILDACAHEPTYLPAVTLSAFTGLRSIEAHHQRWEDINFEDRYLNVTRAKEGTPANRFVPLCEAAIAWLSLTPEKERKGLVHPEYETDVFTLIRRFISTKLGLKLPSNCFRKSWISHRLAVKPNVAEIALEAGHGAAVEIRNYRGAVNAKQGEAWFATMPAPLSGQRPVRANEDLK
jgi:integrase